MTLGFAFATLAIATATMTLVLVIYELHLRGLNARVSRAIKDVPVPSSPIQDATRWLSSLGARYRRFYSAENLEQLRTIVQSSGSSPHKALSIWIGVKTVSMILAPILALIVGVCLGKPPRDLFIFVLLGLAAGLMGPRLILVAIKRRFDAAISRGTPDMIDLLVVCSEAGMGLESAVERVAEEMKRSIPPWPGSSTAFSRISRYRRTAATPSRN